jgi:hypothetical protein
VIAVQILEDSDLMHPEDWCRPLVLTSMSGGMSDGYSFKSEYTGTPENNAKWVRVKHVIGEGWHGHPIGEFAKALGYRHEFVRGDVPVKHCLPLKGYNVLKD